jgi:hypothetical protein
MWGRSRTVVRGAAFGYPRYSSANRLTNALDTIERKVSATVWTKTAHATTPSRA